MNKRYVKPIVTSLFVGLFIWFYISNPEVFDELSNVNPLLILFVVFFQFSGLIINDLVVKTVVVRLGTKLTFRQGLFSAYISSFGNYFLPFTGGAALRAVYLKRNHGFSYKDFISMMYGMYIISFLATSSVVIVSMLFLYTQEGLFVPSLFIITSFLLIITLSLISKRIRVDDFVLRMCKKIPLLSKQVSKIEKVINGWKKLAGDKKLITKLIIYAFLNILLRSVMYSIIFTGLGFNINMPQAVLYNAIISLSLYFTVTPGSIGVREAMLLLFGGGIFVSESAILAVSLIDRASMMIMLLVLFVWFHFVIRERIRL